jgi:hypothetical protein
MTDPTDPGGMPHGDRAPCPNSPGCQHSAFFHETNVLTGLVECTAADNVVDGLGGPYEQQVYRQVRCACPIPPVTLAEFIAARLSEDETAAKAAGSRPNGPLWEDGTRHTVVAAHINRHDPSRVLREVTAKREILAECSTLVIVGVAYPDEAGPESAARILQLLASVYSDHPDYQDKWKP